MTAIAFLPVPLADTFGIHHGDMGAGWWVLMVLGMLIFWGAVAFLVVWLVRGGVSQITPQAESATDILDRRLASGELSVQEYRERRAILEGTSDGPPNGEPQSSGEAPTAQT